MSSKKARIATASQRENSQSKPLQAFIVGGYRLWRLGLWRLLDNNNNDAGIAVLGEAPHGFEAVKLIAELSPDVLIIDLPLSKLDELEAFRAIKGIENVWKVILTPEILEQDLARASQMGINAVLLKQSSLGELIACIRQNDGACLSARLTVISSAVEPRQSQQFQITEREMEIVEAVVAGHTNKEIASRLQLSVDTVRHHVTNIFNKTGASNRLELVLFAIEKKLIGNSHIRTPEVEEIGMSGGLNGLNGVNGWAH